MITTTLNRTREHGPCKGGWQKLLSHLGKTQADDEPLPFSVILASNGIDDALWCCRAEPQHAKEWRLFAVWCARQVQHLMNDPRSITALDVAERHAVGAATDYELAAALEAAKSAVWDARSAASDSSDAASWDIKSAASAAAMYTAWSSAFDAASSAASSAAARAAASSAAALGDDAWYAEWAAARAAAKAAQAEQFLAVVNAQ